MTPVLTPVLRGRVWARWPPQPDGLLGFDQTKMDSEPFVAVNCTARFQTFLDGEGIQFNNLGDLVSSAIQDEAVFEQLSALILLFSGGAIDFTSASQAVGTNAKCGLIPQLLDNIRD